MKKVLSIILILGVPLIVKGGDLLKEEWLIGKRIVQIVFQGNMKVGEREFLDKMRTKVGDLFSPRRLMDDVKMLYGMGCFDDIRVDAELENEGVRLTFILKEKPVVSSIRFEGNRKVEEKDLLGSISLKQGGFYDPLKGKEACSELIRFYRDKGYYFASVDVETTFDEERDAVALKFKIEEGKVVKIKRINIKGNTAISSLRLSWYMETKRGGIYKEEDLMEDIQRIHLLYADKGYILAKVHEPKVVYDEKMKGLKIDIEIDEGPCFRVGEISFHGNTLFSSNKLKELILTRPGDIYSLRKFQGDLLRIKDHYAKEGYIALRIEPIPSLDQEKGEIDIELRIDEDKRYYLEGVRVEGNLLTRENVIRREILIKPGEVFDGGKLRLSRQRLFNLGYFEEINMETLPGSRPDHKILLITVKERKTGVATLGAGYSSRDGLVGNLQVAQTNLFGRGWKVRLSTNFGGKITRYNLGFLNPWVFDAPTSIGFDLYDTKRDRDTYIESRRGGEIKAGLRMGLYSSIHITHRRDVVEISDVKNGVIKEGVSSTNSISNAILRDTTDNQIDPTRGYKIEIGGEFAGGILGGDVDFYKPRIRTSLHLPIIWRLILSLIGRWGIVTNPVSEKEIPDYEKFYLGGSGSIRGYRELSIHPDDGGGEGMFVANVEVGISMPEHGLRLYTFFDAGNSWLKPEDVTLSDLRCGVGIGLLFQSPIGPIRFDYGYPIGDPKYQDPQFHFGIGPLF